MGVVGEGFGLEAADGEGFGFWADGEGLGLAVADEGFGLGVTDDEGLALGVVEGFGLGVADDEGLALGVVDEGLGLGVADGESFGVAEVGEGFGLLGFSDWLCHSEIGRFTAYSKSIGTKRTFNCSGDCGDGCT